MSHDLVFFNGVRPDGRYLQPPISEEELAERLLAQPPDWHLPRVEDPRGTEDPTRAPIYGVDPDKLEEAGWGVIFPAGVDGRIKRALRDLLDRRAEQAGSEREERYRDDLVYYEGESYDDFLCRYRVPPGPANPDKLPYYLLLVGGPEEIPFEFQFDLDQQYAVGRLDFERIEDYATYARNVVACEKQRRRHTPEISFFGVKNPNDRTTPRLVKELLQPLADRLGETLSSQRTPGWKLRTILGEEATKHRLLELLGGKETPAVLFTAGHGLAFEHGDERQLAQQGALICSEWPGEEAEVRPEYYVTAEDIPDDAQLQGLIVFHFACYGAGSRAQDTFLNDDGEYEEQALHPFVSRLPRRLLAHPKGALAVIGHVDKAWTSSFSLNDTGQPEVFNSVLRCLLDGKPVGAATEYFGQLHGDLATKLEEQSERMESLGPNGRNRFARLRLANRDARNFVVLGDPAVRVGVP